MRCHVAVVLILLFSSAVFSQSQYNFQRLDINDGLSNNQVTCFLKDSKGFMWFGSMSGLNRYDGYSFKIFRHDYRDSSSINDNYIIQLFEDHLNNIWVETRSGMNVYAPQKESFSTMAGMHLESLRIPAEGLVRSNRASNGDVWYLTSAGEIYRFSKKEQSTLKVETSSGWNASGGAINDIHGFDDGSLWLIRTDGVIVKLDSNHHPVVKNDELAKLGLKEAPYRFFVDSDDDLWVYINGSPTGTFYFNSRQNKWRQLRKGSGNGFLNSNLINSVVEDNAGLIWIGTDHGGVNVLDKDDFSVEYIVHDEEDEKSISQNSINAMYKDDTGIIWVGSFKKGLSYFHENLVKFRLYNHRINNPNSLSFNDVNCFEEDKNGGIWIGTNGGGLIYFDRKKNVFKQYRHNPSDRNSLSNDIIVALRHDHENKLWIGTYHGGLNCFDGEKFTRYQHNPADPASLADNRVWEIYEDSDLNLWIGTLGGGLDLFDSKKKAFTHFRSEDVNSIHSNYISSLVEDENSNLWIGAAYGVDIYNKNTGQFIHLVNTNNDPAGLSHNNVICLFRDSRNRMWVGTREGLNLYDSSTRSFRIFRREDGLPDNAILTIVEYQEGNLWIGTPNGLSNLVIKGDSASDSVRYSFRNYDISDGLQGREFNENAALRTSTGELLFGGANGFNIFNPVEINENQITPKAILTDFQVYNKSVKIGEKVNGRVILDKAISETSRIYLKYKENMFAIEFAALSFFHPGKNLYRYKLEGFNDDWIQTDGSMRKAVFTNLDPGEYTFRLRASNNDQLWNQEDVELQLTVLPPLWRSNLAFIVYIMIIFGFLMLSRKLILLRERSRQSLEQERGEARRRHMLDLLKIRFFTNISHEFRTPLSLIITPLDRLIHQAKDEQVKQQYDMIARNARRLLNLVNQLLDFRRLEVQELKLAPVHMDAVGFIKDISFSFSDIAEKKKINFSFSSQPAELIMAFDPDKLERILFNLLSNAFKFTAENGRVSIEVDTMECDGKQWLEIRIKDNGIGIPPEKQDKIFERFFQDDLPEEFINQGSGIGLSITRAFVRLHAGRIRVESEVGKGSCFTVELPFSSAVQPIAAGGEILPVLSAKESPEINPAELKTNGRKIVLLVEDNEDLRFYLKDNLKAHYNVIEAANGVSGFDLALQTRPDLIVSDIVMPGMSGIELCMKIREHRRMSHIPFILLTAKSSEEQKLEGYEAGADEYITKPFNFEILLYKIRNLIGRVKQNGRAAYMDINPKEVQVTPQDEKLMQRSLEIVEQRMADPDFSVKELSRELGMSRVNLYKKLLTLTGKSPIEFIRIVRLKRAAQLLEKSQLSVSEIAYQVGFNNPKYFTRYFKEEFNTLPSRYAARKESPVQE